MAPTTPVKDPPKKQAAMEPSVFLASLRARGVDIAADGDTLRVRWPEGTKTAKLTAYLKTFKAELLALLRRDAEEDAAPAPEPALADPFADLPAPTEAELRQARAVRLLWERAPYPVSVSDVAADQGIGREEAEAALRGLIAEGNTREWMEED